MTVPGSVLRFGQKAVIPLRSLARTGDSGFKAGVVGVTVHRIKAAPTSVLPWNVVGVPDNKKYRVYYATVTITNEDGLPNLAGTQAGLGLEGLTREGYSAPVGHGDGLDLNTTACNKPHDVPVGFARRGAAFKDCVIEIATIDDPIAQVVYNQEPYDGEAITWR